MIIATTVRLKIGSNFFILQIYETYRAFAQNGGVALWFGVSESIIIYLSYE